MQLNYDDSKEYPETNATYGIDYDALMKQMFITDALQFLPSSVEESKQNKNNKQNKTNE